MATLEELKTAMKWCLDHPGEHIKCGQSKTLWWDPTDFLFFVFEEKISSHHLLSHDWKVTPEDYLKDFEFEELEHLSKGMTPEQCDVLQAAEAWKNKVNSMGLGFAAREQGYLYDRVRRMQEGVR